MPRILTYLLSASLLTSCGPTTVGFTPAAQISNEHNRGTPANVPVVGGCQIFPANNWWNTDISNYPLDPRSPAYIAALPGNLHPDFGEDSHYGIPFNIVPSTQKKVPVHFLLQVAEQSGAVSDSAKRANRGWAPCRRRPARARLGTREM
jgi:hypothetical protein